MIPPFSPRWYWQNFRTIICIHLRFIFSLLTDCVLTLSFRFDVIIDKMNAIHWKGSREKFQAAHQQEIDLYYTSQRILTEKHGVKKIDILRWKKEQTALRHEEEERSAQYKPLREKLDLMLNVKYCVDEAKRRINKELIQTKQKQKKQPVL